MNENIDASVLTPHTPLSSRNPVVMVHGIWDTGKIFLPMSLYLSRLGWTVYDLDLTPNNGDGRLEYLAEQVAEFIDRTFAPDAPIDLVGFSMGGLVSRYYVQRLGGIDHVQRLITLSSPHNGTWVAYGSFRSGCLQMRPNSAFLQDLNQDVAMLDRLNFTSIWTPFDAMIVPANSSQLPVGREMRVWVPAHHYMISDAQSLKAVTTALTEPLRS
ncbi:triacylglycerol lipase [Leptolyngbya sp. FACHB-36]|uniref:esterase/lipase family protein n=1 Tax=Leptolyngbya sp. FACHB-36 TaxID=2692808 RepID=UPI001680A126|nr:triacylglycerol lipase [Leptolyngbya sp. FACHB-36]MBD2020940.1 triacylglycerol lipase [Leptolyngbya sp. FACHB-36]